MRKLVFIILISASAARGQNPHEKLTVEKIMQDPKWIGSSPADVFWNVDGKSLYFAWNPEKKISDSFYQYSILAKQTSKAAYKEALFAGAVHEGIYNSSRSKIVYLFKGDLYLLNLGTQSTARITQTADEKSKPGFTLQDKWVTYTCGDNLFAWSIQNGETIQLTNFIKGDRPSPKKQSEQEQWLMNEQWHTSNVIKEKKEKREAHNKFLQSLKGADTLVKIYIGEKQVQDIQISPDARFILYRLEEQAKNEKRTIVPNYVTESGFTENINGRTKVGAPHGQYTNYILDRLTDSIVKINTDSIPGISDPPDYWKDYPENKDRKPSHRPVFISSLRWNESGNICVADILSWDHKDRWLMVLNPTSGILSLVDRQRDEAWIAGPGISWLDEPSTGWIDNTHYYFHSEVTGYSHLYSYDFDSKTRKALSAGNYEVLKSFLSHDKKYFYILTNEEHPGKKHLYRIRTDGSEKKKLTTMDGDYEISLSPDEKYIAYRYSNQNTPWELYIQENGDAGKPLQVTHMAMSAEWKTYPWRDPKIFHFAARDGKQVYAKIYEPAAGNKNKAAIIFVHGAGYLQNVAYSWSYYFREFMFNNLLADKGYTVLDIDYRASAGYGRDWRTAIYRYMGGKDLDDEVDGAKYLVKAYGIDSSRIGLYGGSYGGFMTLMALFTQPDVFKVGAAVRPVTDWAHYNDSYTSSILNEPFTDSIAYARSSPINFASGLKGHLLICHGMVDVNVHFGDPVRLTQRLIELGKDNWELAAYPVEDHAFEEPSSWTDEYKRILKLFETYL
jgi:dipeptidyl aminopeptidase/acylaminoacyl peptidase